MSNNENLCDLGEDLKEALKSQDASLLKAIELYAQLEDNTHLLKRNTGELVKDMIEGLLRLAKKHGNKESFNIVCEVLSDYVYAASGECIL